MVPRLHARGRSFKGSCRYVLHDPKATTRDRVAWTLTRNLHSDPDHAWFEMAETARNQGALKANAGLSARGRKNDRPVLHYTLAWHADDAPTPERMRDAALASLKVLGLDEHEALIAAHDDKEHPHVHIIANTVHPYTGRTATLKYSKECLSEWAEAYEREHGRIRCEERVKNNEKRRAIRDKRDKEKFAREFAGAVATPPAPFVPVKDASPNRRRWFDRKEITDRVKRLRAALELTHKLERGVTWDRQKRERDALDQNTKAAVDHARAHVREAFRPRWRDLYRAHFREKRFIARSATHPLERAVFVFANRHRLAEGRPLTLRRLAGLILSPKRLASALERAHEREKRVLASHEKKESKALTDRIWTVHRERFQALRDRQAKERAAEHSHQRLAAREIGFARAKADLIRELEKPPPARAIPRPIHERPQPTREFNQAASGHERPTAPDLSRADQIRREMEEWRRRNKGRDHGREL